MSFEFSAWFCLIPFYLITLAFTYMMLVATQGIVAARKMLPQVLLIYAISTFVMAAVMLLPSEELGTRIVDIARLGVVLIVVPAMVLKLRKNGEAGAVLLDLGHMRGYRIFMAIFILIIVVGLVSLVRSLWAGLPGWRQVLDSLFPLAIGVEFGLLQRQRVQLRERGLVYGVLIPWEQITGYGWEPADTRVLTLRVRRIVPILHLPIFHRVVVTVPPEHVAAADQVLAQHIGAVAPASG
jgi:hypothetical protein